MNNLPPNLWSAEDFVELEQLIAGAKDLVVPSSGFKARVVGSASAIDQSQVHFAKLRTLFLMALVAWIVFAIILFLVSGNSSGSTSQTDSAPTTSPSSSQTYSTRSSDGSRTPD